MATYSPNVSEKGSTSLNDDSEVINLRPYLETFFSWWREIFLLTIITAAIGGALALIQRTQTPPTYRAEAQVAIARIVTTVNLDDTFQTSTGSLAGPDGIARRSSLLGLVKNGTVARQVIEELGPILNGGSATQLLNQIDADFIGDNVSDLIQISAFADTPEKAAAIANSWARHYVNHINILYGELPTEIAEIVEQEVGRAEITYEETQQAYEQFLAENDIQSLTREIDDKQQLIASLQATRQANIARVISQTVGYRKNVIDSYLQTVHQNRLLAFTGEQEANRTLVQNLIQAISENRQLAFQTEHQARIQLFTQYAELELQNRLLAMKQEQDAKSQLFQAYSNADIQSKLSVFNQQVNGKVANLVSVHSTKRRLEELLVQARALQQQIEQAGEASATSNGLPLLLLKIEAYATASESNATNSVLVGNLQLNLDNNNWETDIENQEQDLAVLVETLTGRIAELDTQIEQQSLSLFNNEGYQLLDKERPEADPLYAAIQQQYLELFNLDGLAQSASALPDDTVLSQAIVAKYDELFGIGALSTASLTISNTTPIYEALEAQYPSLFTLGDLSQLGELLATDSALGTASQQKLLELLQPDADLESYLTVTDVGAEPLLQLEEQVRGLQSTLESQQAKQARLIDNRDRALETYNALRSKSMEFALERTASGREVRLAAEANPPSNPIPGISFILVGIAFGIGGFLLAIIIAFLSSYMDAPPFLSRLRPAPVSPVSHVRR